MALMNTGPAIDPTSPEAKDGFVLVQTDTVTGERTFDDRIYRYRMHAVTDRQTLAETAVYNGWTNWSYSVEPAATMPMFQNVGVNV